MDTTEAAAAEGSSTSAGGAPKAAAQRGPAKSKSSRAGLKFPVGRVRRKLRLERVGASRISDTATVYIAAVLEYMAAELLELAGNDAKTRKRKRIDVKSLRNAVNGDDELLTFCRNNGITLPMQ